MEGYHRQASARAAHHAIRTPPFDNRQGMPELASESPYLSD